jgi:hypothetical protein
MKQVAKWAELRRMRSFVKQKHIKMELEESYHDLQTCSMQFNVRRISLSVACYARPPLPFHILADRIASKCKQPEPRVRGDCRHGRNELIEMITGILQNKDHLKIALASGTPEDARSVVQAIEQARSRIFPCHSQNSHLTYRN